LYTVKSLVNETNINNYVISMLLFPL